VVDGERILLYAVDADRGPGQRESTGLFTSTDGLTFQKQPFAIEGNPAKKALDPCVVRDPAAFPLLPRVEIDGTARHRDHDVATSAIGVSDMWVSRGCPGLSIDVFLGGTWFCDVRAREPRSRHQRLTFVPARPRPAGIRDDVAGCPRRRAPPPLRVLSGQARRQRVSQLRLGRRDRVDARGGRAAQGG
jgi:hypothetical protein